MIRNFLASAAIAVMALGSAASAATLSFSATPTTAFANPLGNVLSGVAYQNVTDPGLVSGVRRSPWEGSSLDGSVYSSITGTLKFTFSSLRTQLSLVWGSPDGYNSLEFYKNGTKVETVSGNQIVGCCGANVANSLVSISGFGQFNEVRFISGSPAFEFANVAAVPLPAGGLLLLGALGGVTALRRRKAA